MGSVQRLPSIRLAQEQSRYAGADVPNPLPQRRPQLRLVKDRLLSRRARSEGAAPMSFSVRLGCPHGRGTRHGSNAQKIANRLGQRIANRKCRRYLRMIPRLVVEALDVKRALEIPITKRCRPTDDKTIDQWRQIATGRTDPCLLKEDAPEIVLKIASGHILRHRRPRPHPHDSPNNTLPSFRYRCWPNNLRVRAYPPESSSVESDKTPPTSPDQR